MDAAMMPRERRVPVAVGKVRRTVTLREELIAQIDSWRSVQRPIPTESQAFAELLRQAIEQWRLEVEQQK
jgi:hypothetical protein